MFWITRPIDDGERLAARLRDVGIESFLCPLLEPCFLTPPLPGADDIAGLIATSRNGLKALESAGLPFGYKDLPIFVVGPASAELASSLGFQDVRQPAEAGGAKALVPLLARAGSQAQPWLLLRGEDMAVDLQAHLADRDVQLLEIVMYRMGVPAALRNGLSPRLVRTIKSGTIEGVILMSSRTAAVYGEMMRTAKLEDEMSKMLHVCLSSAVADTLKGPHSTDPSLLPIVISDRPDLNALVERVLRRTEPIAKGR